MTLPDRDKLVRPPAQVVGVSAAAGCSNPPVLFHKYCADVRRVLRSSSSSSS
jgi:hypothetical protein